MVLEVLASWCGACRRAAPTVSAAAGARRERPIEFVGISVDKDRADVEAIREDWGIRHPLVLDDGSFSRRYKHRGATDLRCR